MLYLFFVKTFFTSTLENFLKMENLHIRYYIQMRVKLGNDAISIHNEFKIVKVDQAPSYSTIQRWVKHFKEGKQQLKDKAPSGRRITAITKQKQWFVSFLQQQALKPLHIGIKVRSSITNHILIIA
jgi:transposase